MHCLLQQCAARAWQDWRLWTAVQAWQQARPGAGPSAVRDRQRLLAHLSKELVPDLDAQAVIKQGAQQPAVVHEWLKGIVLQSAGRAQSLEGSRPRSLLAGGGSRACGGRCRRRCPGALRRQDRACT